MIAFKIFSQCSEDKKPIGIPGSWPWQEAVVPSERTSEMESLGYIVKTEQEYLDYKAANLGLYSAWLTSQTAVLTKKAIEDRIEQYQKAAPGLLRDLYATNTMAGISTPQSDQLVDDYQDVLLRIREGLFPTALYRLSFKRPSGFVTQVMLDQWRDKILALL